MARLNVRLAEIEASLSMIGRLVHELPAGGTRHSPGPLSVEQALGWAESARGETLYYLRAADRDRLAFCKLRAASFVNFGVFNRIFASQVLTDFGFIEHSFGLSPAGCDA
jgi:Ni,Fe-hydrogenase III large subunit